jgi:iron complex outermembrane receptor protein
MKKLNTVKLPLAACLVSLSCSALTQEMEEVIITASLIDASSDSISNPLHVVNGESVATDASQSIGASIDGLVGVSSSDYGAAVGQPIIRGMSGSRVKILNNGVVIRDVSGLGPDHVNDADLNNIQQIEIVRGPSSLLYSNGTIGGIVNIVDNTITRKDFEESRFKLGLEAQSVNDGDSHDFSYQNNIGGLNISAAYKDSKFGDFDIPNGAVIHHEEEHPPGEEPEEEHEEDLDHLPNSDAGSTSKRVGISKTGDWGYFGLSFSDNENLYGVPFHGEEHEPPEGGVHEEERIFSTTDSNIINLEGSYLLGNSWLTKIDYHFRDSDYSHTEQHAEEEGHVEPDPGHPEEGPTTFSNDAREYGAIFDLGNDSLSQKVAVNYVVEDVAVTGDEAFINPTESKELTLGYYLSKELELFHVDFGIRHDQISRKGSVSHTGEKPEYFDRDIDTTGYALTLSRDINDSVEVSLGLSSVERAPSAVELLMNGPHLATGRFEVGNFNLKSEQSNNIDLTFHYSNDGLYAGLTFFQNDVNNYIYLMDEDDDHIMDEDDDHPIDGDDDPHHDLPHANYLQQDAEFKGYELEIGKTFDLARGALTLAFGRDSVSGEFTDGHNIPRMTPERDLYKVVYVEETLKFVLSLKDVSAQNDTAENETASDGFQMLNLNLSKTIESSSGNILTLSVFGKNLLDEAARNHSSFVKDEVPLAGRNLGVRASYSF